MRFLPLLTLLTGCGEMGLEPVASLEGEPLVAVEPDGQIRFDRASPEGRSQSQEVDIRSDGDAAAYVSDVWIETSTADVFYTGDDLPFPRVLEPGEAIPITIRFAPISAGTFHGTLVIESGTEGTLLERQLVGEGCQDADHDGDC